MTDKPDTHHAQTEHDEHRKPEDERIDDDSNTVREDEIPEDGLGSFEDRVLHHANDDEDPEHVPHFPIPPAD